MRKIVLRLVSPDACVEITSNNFDTVLKVLEAVRGVLPNARVYLKSVPAELKGDIKSVMEELGIDIIEL